MSATATATMTPTRAEIAAEFRDLAQSYFRRSDELTDEDLAECRRLMHECFERMPKASGDRTLKDQGPARIREYEDLSAARKLFGKAIVRALRLRIDRTARCGHLILTIDQIGDLFVADLDPRRPVGDRKWLRNMLDNIRPGLSRR